MGLGTRLSKNGVKRTGRELHSYFSFSLGVTVITKYGSANHRRASVVLMHNGSASFLHRDTSD